MKIASILVLIIGTLLGGCLYLTSYRSAFEADQACHYEKTKVYESSSSFGCDHDTETSQWILYELENSGLPAKVIKRFRY